MLALKLACHFSGSMLFRSQWACTCAVRINCDGSSPDWFVAVFASACDGHASFTGRRLDRTVAAAVRKAITKARVKSRCVGRREIWASIVSTHSPTSKDPRAEGDLPYRLKHCARLYEREVA